MITLSTTKFYAYVLSSMMLFMIAIIGIPQMYSAQKPAQAYAAKETVVMQCEIR